MKNKIHTAKSAFFTRSPITREQEVDLLEMYEIVLANTWVEDGEELPDYDLTLEVTERN